MVFCGVPTPRRRASRRRHRALRPPSLHPTCRTRRRRPGLRSSKRVHALCTHSAAGRSIVQRPDRARFWRGSRCASPRGFPCRCREAVSIWDQGDGEPRAHANDEGTRSGRPRVARSNYRATSVTRASVGMGQLVGACASNCASRALLNRHGAPCASRVSPRAQRDRLGRDGAPCAPSMRGATRCERDGPKGDGTGSGMARSIASALEARARVPRSLRERRAGRRRRGAAAISVVLLRSCAGRRCRRARQRRLDVRRRVAGTPTTKARRAGSRTEPARQRSWGWD